MEPLSAPHREQGGLLEPVPSAAAPLRHIPSRVLRWMALVTLFALTMELCARTDDAVSYGAPFWGAYGNERLRGKDPRGFTCNIPNARFEKWQHNSLGFRGPEVARRKPPGVTRIVCLGSSESYGLYESPGKEWPAQLKELLPKSEYEVVNGSVVGLGLGSFKAYLEKHLLPLEPDVIILVMNPLFYVSSQSSRAQKLKLAAAPAAPPAPSLKEWLMGNSRLFPKVKEVMKHAVSSNFPQTFKRYELVNMQREVREIEQARLLGGKAMDTVPKSYLANFERDLEATVELIRSRGAQVVLTSYPALISRENLAMHPEIFLDNRRFCIHLSLNGQLDAFSSFNSVVARVSREHGVPFVDAHRFVPKSLEYFGDNVHYTDRGAQVFAASVSRILASQSDIARYRERKVR